MSRMHNMPVSAALLVTLLALSACATQSKPETVVAPAPVAVAEQAVPAPTVKAEVPAVTFGAEWHRSVSASCHLSRECF